MATAKKLSALNTATPADADSVAGMDDSAATPAAKNVRFTLSDLASYFLGKREAVMSQEEAEAGTVSDRRGVSPLRLAQAIAALTPAGTPHQLDATAAPVATDDETDDWEVGSLWIWPAEERVWICVDPSTNVAVWVEMGRTELPDVVSEAEAEAGIATTARLWTAQRVREAIEALGPEVALPDVVSQAEAEAGTSTTARLWTAQRVAQAIAALESVPALPDVVGQAEAEAGTATTARLWTAQRVAQAIAALQTAAGMSNPMTTNGDLIVGGASGAPARLAPGSDGQVLGRTASGTAWGWLAGGPQGNYDLTVDEQANYSAIQGRLVRVDPSAAAIDFELGSSGSPGVFFWIVALNAVNTSTLTRASGVTINGAASDFVLTAGTAYHCFSAEAGVWYVK